MQCPICGAPAEDVGGGDFDGLVVDCRRCGRFAVASDMLNAFPAMEYEQRLAALEKARSIAAHEATPTIAAPA